MLLVAAESGRETTVGQLHKRPRGRATVSRDATHETLSKTRTKSRSSPDLPSETRTYGCQHCKKLSNVLTLLY
jgi:hypothetical protein